MFNLYGKELTQQEIYSPTPTIKIKKWYVKVCSACIHSSRDFGEYDNVGWAYCEEDKKLGNLKPFPYCSAKKCKSFSSIAPGMESDWWELTGNMICLKLKNDLDIKIAHSVLEFNKRMGNYKVGRII